MSMKPWMIKLAFLTLLATPHSVYAEKPLENLRALPEPQLARPTYQQCLVQDVEYGCLDLEQARQLARVYAHYKLLHRERTQSAQAVGVLLDSNEQLTLALDAQRDATRGVVLELEMVRKRRDDALKRATRAEAFHVKRYIPWIALGAVACFAGGLVLGVKWSTGSPRP